MAEAVRVGVGGGVTVVEVVRLLVLVSVGVATKVSLGVGSNVLDCVGESVNVRVGVGGGVIVSVFVEEELIVIELLSPSLKVIVESSLRYTDGE